MTAHYAYPLNTLYDGETDSAVRGLMTARSASLAEIMRRIVSVGLAFFPVTDRYGITADQGAAVLDGILAGKGRSEAMGRLVRAQSAKEGTEQT